MVRRRGPATVGLVAVGVALSAPAIAGDSVSPSFRHRDGRFGAIAASLHDSSASQILASARVFLSGDVAWAPAGRPDSLRALLPGPFWVALGESPTLDLDGDGAPYFLDIDDDGDGLLDVHETNTCAFVSAENTGTSAFAPDSDGDGFPDGVEVASGSDPTDPFSHPASTAVPSLAHGARLVLALLLTALGLRGFRRPVGRIS